MQGRRWISAIGWTLVGSVAGAFAFTGLTWRSPWQQILQQTGAIVAFSGSCVTLCLIALPTVTRRARRLPFPLNWVAILAALVVLGTVGSLIATTVGVATGFIPPRHFFTSWYP